LLQSQSTPSKAAQKAIATIFVKSSNRCQSDSRWPQPTWQDQLEQGAKAKEILGPVLDQVPPVLAALTLLLKRQQVQKQRQE